MGEFDEIARDTLAVTPEWVQNAMRRHPDGIACFVFGRWPEEGMTWRANMVDALDEALKPLG